MSKNRGRRLVSGGLDTRSTYSPQYCSLVTEVARVRVTAVAPRRGPAGSSSGRGPGVRVLGPGCRGAPPSGRGAGARVPRRPAEWPGAGVRPADRSAGAVAVVSRVAV